MSGFRFPFRIPSWPAAALLAVTVVTTGFFLLAHEGLYGLDDTLYARYAARLAAGELRLPADPHQQLHDPLLHRPAVYGPVAACFRWLGISIWTATLWPLLATLLTGAALVALLGRRAPFVAAGAVVLLGLSQHTLWLATYLYGDNVLMLLALLSAGVLWRFREGGGRSPAVWAVAFVAATLTAFLAKETIAWYVPAYLWIAALDGWRGRHRRFWLCGAVVGAGALAAYFGLYAYLTGDAFQRFRLVEATNEFLRSGNYGARSSAALVARLTWQPVVMLAGSGLGLVVWPAVLAGARRGFRDRLLLRGPDRWEGVWLLLALLGGAAWWWGSTSLRFWNPISLLPRMFSPLLPPVAILAGVALREWRAGRLGGVPVALGFLALAVLARNSVSGLYGVLAAGALWWGRPRAVRPAPGWVIAALIVLLTLRPAWQMARPSVSDYRGQLALIRKYLSRPGSLGREVVLTDRVLLAQYPFWYGFEPPSYLDWRSFAAADSLPPGTYRRVWLLVNEATLLNPDNPALRATPPKAIYTRFPERQLVERRGRVSLYTVSGF